MYISLHDLGSLILFLIYSVLGVVATVFLLNLIKFVKSARTLIDKNKDNIDNTLEIIPKTISNINDTTLAIKDGVKKTTEIVDVAGETFAETVATVSQGTESLLSQFSILSPILGAIISLFSKDK